jgi:WD40 repeat protein
MSGHTRHATSKLLTLLACSFLCCAGCGPTQQLRIFVANIVTSVHFSPDGELIAVSGGTKETVGEGDGYVWVWDTESGQLRYRIDDFSSTVYGLAFANNGNTLITSGNRYERKALGNPYVGTEVVTWDADNGSQKGEKIFVKSAANKCFDFDEGQHRFLIGGNIEDLTLCDYPPGGKSKTIFSHTGVNYNRCFVSSDSDTICATGERTGKAFFFDVQTGDYLTVGIAQSEITAAAHSSTDDSMLFGDEKGTIYKRRMSANPKEAKSECLAHASAVGAIAVSPDGKTIASGDATGEIMLRSADLKSNVLKIAAPSGPILGLAFSPRDGRLLSAGRTPDGRWELILWDSKSGSEIRRFTPTIP